MVYFVYYTNYYYYVDSVWDTQEAAEKRLAKLLKKDKDWAVGEVPLNDPGAAASHGSI